MSYERTCTQCQTKFSSRMPNGKYCSDECRRRANYTLVGHGLSTGTVGAMSELRASTDLMKRGYEVFRALSPSTSCDLAVLKGGKLITVEVRSGRIHEKTNRVTYCETKIRADVVAIVLPDKIIYEGNLP